MAGYLQPTVVQAARGVLAALHSPAPLAAGSRDVVASLIACVGASRDDPRVREMLARLLDEMAESDGARLPAPRCEGRDAAALADELRRLMDDRAVVPRPRRPRRPATFLAAAALLAGLAVGAGCGDERQVDDEIDCAADTTAAHFNGVIESADGLTADEIAAVEADYEQLGPEQRRDVMKALCGMSAEQIADYVRDGYAGDAHPPDGDDDTDAAPVYKGVTF